MSDDSTFDYTIQIEINASRDDVWAALANRINDWWPADARMVAPDSVVSLDASAGGGLLELSEGTGSLLWYTVQLSRDGESLELAGDLGAAWGGPARSLLSLSLADAVEGTTLTLSDALIGSVAPKTVEILQSGWTTIVTALKEWIEAQSAATESD